MQIYSQKSEYTLLQGNMLDMGDFVGGGTIDSIVTDPPYELNFMGKGWDNSGIAFQPDTWKRCLEVLKPGGYLLAFGGSRTYHRIACAIEDAGFEIRDCIMWLYGSGFPKSMNIGLAIDKKNGVRGEEYIDEAFLKRDPNKLEYDESINNGFKDGLEGSIRHKVQNERAGWGTALKPSYEPIIVARKPLEGSCTDNVIKYGVGGINIDECRVETNDDLNGGAYRGKNTKQQEDATSYYIKSPKLDGKEYNAPIGRFPANTILTYDETDFNEVCGGFPNTKSNGGKTSMPDLRDVGRKSKEAIGIDKLSFGQVSNVDRKESNYIAPCDSGSASRYFYCAKASKKDRDEGLDEFEAKTKVFNGHSDKPSEEMKDVEKRFTTVGRNSHPTVKPTSLMQYLIRLVTPNGGTVLDPFNGSGSTGKAVMYENKDRNKNYKYIGIELTEEYLPIAKARIEYVINKGIEKEKSEPKQEEQTKQRKESALF